MNLYVFRFRVTRISQCLAGSQQIRTFFNTLKRNGDNVNTKELVSGWKAKVAKIVESSIDTVTASPLQLLTITLRRKYITDDIPATQIPPEGTQIPPNYHLAYFLPRVYEDDLENDGSETRYG